MVREDIGLMAHLMRRAAFGAPYAQLEERTAQGYQATVEELLHPDGQADLERDIILRYRTQWLRLHNLEGQQEEWVYTMINTSRPLEEKIALFWHSVFCTGHAKCDNGKQQKVQMDLFRFQGMGSFRDLLIGLSKDPAMVFFLDNCMSHREAINENWGRELLELFSMGVGMDERPNYTEDDVKVCAQAFTGWTIGNPIPTIPYGRLPNQFFYNPDDHDDTEKTFLGEKGRFNGEDVIDIICKHPATARFVSRHLYNFFVADEPGVPAWQRTPPRDLEAIKGLEDEYFRSHYNIGSMLRFLFTSDFFKEARFQKVKSPTETVIGTMRLVGDYRFPKPGLSEVSTSIRYMGQDLLNPPTVEGWHGGKDWIDSGTLLERINFTAQQMGNVELPGVRAIVDRLKTQGATISPDRLLDHCLDMLGCYQLEGDTRDRLLEQARSHGDLRPSSKEFPEQVGQTLQMIVSTTEYLFA